MKSLLKFLIVLFGLLVIGVILMAVLNLCPPPGPWPMPPWCSEKERPTQPITLPSIPAKETTPTPEGRVYRTGETITLAAEDQLNFDQASAEFSWTQLFYPDRYSGVELISGTVLEWEHPTPSSITFTPEWPGSYHIQLDLTDANGVQQTILEVLVQPELELFDLSGAALDYWNYPEEKAGSVAPAIFQNLTGQGIQLVMFSPTWYMPSRTSPEIEPCPLEEFDPNICRGVISDEVLLQLIEEAHDQGLDVLIKPHLKILNDDYPEWPGYMEISNWADWFASYSEFVLYYAALAEENGAEHLSLGNELGNNCTAQTNLWRDLIQDVRAVYSGQLSYHDNMFSYQGSEAKFWDDLDYIGVNLWAPASGVFGVPESTHPSLEEMVQALDGQLAKTLDPVAEQFNKPVLISEFGTVNYDGSNIDFWEYSGPTDNGEQAAFYEAGLRVFASRPYIEGVILWAYDWEKNTSPGRQTMSPLNKPAEEMFSLWVNSPQ
jgi:hypothetical protein